MHEPGPEPTRSQNGGPPPAALERRLSDVAVMRGRPNHPRLPSSTLQPPCDLSETATVDGATYDDYIEKQISPPSTRNELSGDTTLANTTGYNSPGESSEESTPGNQTPRDQAPRHRTRSHQTRGHPQFNRENSLIQVGKSSKTKWRAFPQKGYKTTTKYFYQEIDSSWTVAMIVTCYFVSGIVDSAAFATFGVFVNLQTGNTILVALRVASHPSAGHSRTYIKSLTSMACYNIGALVFNLLHRAPVGISSPRIPLHRWCLFASFFIQSSCLVIAAILAQTGVVSTGAAVPNAFSSGRATIDGPGPTNYKDVIPVAFLAFEAAGQVCLSRALSINELPTIVISTLYHDFMAEALQWPALWRQSKSKWEFMLTQKKQVRRILSIIALFCGALVGGFNLRFPKAGLSAALWVAAGLKVVVCVAFSMWKKKVITETVVERSDRPPQPR